MKALVWHGTRDVRVDTVPDPELKGSRDIIIEVTSTAICGSDLHLYNGYIPTMKSGDILGHEFMGRVVDKGRAVKDLAVGDRVVVPFPIACGACWFCQTELWSLCDNTNPNAEMAEAMFGHAPAGLFGYSHLTGGYPGGQAEYVRVPYADVGPIKIPDGLADEQVLFLSDILPTGWQAAEQCGIVGGDVVAVWGCGPVGLFAIESARLLGAERVIAIDRLPERLELARRLGAEVIDYTAIGNTVQVVDHLRAITGGRGPDACIDAVGLEAHGIGLEGFYDKVKQAVRAETGRPTALRQCILACRKGGTVSIPGVYGGLVDKVPMGALMNKGLTVRTGQTHVHRYLEKLLHRISEGEIDPAIIITHTRPLSEAAEMYATFSKKQDDCIKVVLKP
ncbi:MAG: glutathione-dependent formaldehyde dehydrogenase [Myxococcales bacterium]|nr:glutathione-dependent formaldehyde dehydrogenase [Myxococcales bacterium]MCB9542861.1 glutathione-dependent formaldehyde dehydrogenase [Myxococcales bacterium]MCB9553701.1 glutathione-dependent formaldehyde dehydrogenase [Myxococcales bacterium]